MKPSLSKVCFYIMTVDTGFAPNPFHEVCTLAACTPNHCRANLYEGDLIAGCFRSGGPPLVVYVMEVDAVLTLDQYYRDTRFAAKKPLRNKTWIERTGDNIYYRDGKWCQDTNAQHHKTTPIDPVKNPNPEWKRDLKGDRVYIGKRFIYFGEQAQPLPERFACYLPGRGVKYLKNDQKVFEDFSGWAFKHPLGLVGFPRDRESSATCAKPSKCRSC